MGHNRLTRTRLFEEFFEQPSLEGHISATIRDEDKVHIILQYQENISLEYRDIQMFYQYLSTLSDPEIVIDSDNRGPQVKLTVSKETYREET